MQVSITHNALWAQQITQIYRFLTQSMIFLPMINKYAQSLRWSNDFFMLLRGKLIEEVT